MAAYNKLIDYWTSPRGNTVSIFHTTDGYDFIVRNKNRVVKAWSKQSNKSLDAVKKAAHKAEEKCLSTHSKSQRTTTSLAHS